MKDIKTFIQLRAKGCSLREIAEKLGKSLGSISAMNKKLMPEVTELRKSEIAEYCKKLDAIRTKRISLLNFLLDKLQFDLETKNVGLYYDDTVKLYLKVSDKLSAFDAESLKMRMDVITMDDASVEILNSDASTDKPNIKKDDIEQI
jgi:transcriptional regulator